MNLTTTEVLELVDLSSYRTQLEFGLSRGKLDTELDLFEKIKQLREKGIPCHYLPGIELTLGEEVVKATIAETAYGDSGLQLVVLRTDEHFIVVALDGPLTHTVAAYRIPFDAEETLTGKAKRLRFLGPLGPYVV